MKVLHAPGNIAGQPFEMVKALRQRRIDATMLVFRERPFLRGADENLRLDECPTRLHRYARQVAAFARAAGRYDIFHFHAGASLLPRSLDLGLLRGLGKKVIMQFWGCELRNRVPRAVRCIGRVDRVLLGSYHQLDFAPPGAEVVPVAIDLSAWPPTFEPPLGDDGAVVIAHAPSDRQIKGTAHVLAAVEELERRGRRVRLDLVEGVPHEDARTRYARAHVVVDQLVIGWHGIFAVEAMALGKPVVLHVRREWADRAEAHLGLRLPAVPATPDTLADELDRLVADASLRAELGRRSREYVVRVHDIHHNVQRLIGIYQDLLA